MYDVIVLGAGVVGTCAALQLQKKGLSVALLDSQEPGMATSFGNAGVIECNTLFPYAFPRDISSLVKIALNRSPLVNYHLSFLPTIAPWLFAYYRATSPKNRLRTATLMRPLFRESLMEHIKLMKECNGLDLLNENGWLKIYRSESSFRDNEDERILANKYGITFKIVDSSGARDLEPTLKDIFPVAVHWQGPANVRNPLKLTERYYKRFTELGGVFVHGDARDIVKSGALWMQSGRSLSARNIVVALGPWTSDFLQRFGIKLPLAVKRGYHQHFKHTQGCTLHRPVLDYDVGYFLSDMETGVRMTTGAEFADRDAPPSPAQLGRILPRALELVELGPRIEQTPWIGCRPCFADSMPVIGRAPGEKTMWLACGHAHWGLTLGAVSGRLLAEMIAGEQTLCDPSPYAAERFLK